MTRRRNSLQTQRLRIVVPAFMAGVYIAFTLACLPAVSLAQVQPSWTSSGQDFRPLGVIRDLNGDGIVDLLSRETPGSAMGSISVRSLATGMVQAQTTVTTYAPGSIQYLDLDGDGSEEILFVDASSGALVCLPFAGPPGPMVARWSLNPYFGAHAHFFADLDGNGQLYVVFQELAFMGGYSFYDRNGILVNHYTPNAPFGWVPEQIEILDVDGDGRDEVLLVYRDIDNIVQKRHLILLESVAPVSVESGPVDIQSVQLGVSAPNPARASTRINYTLSARGLATLRVMDVSGREVRTLAQGEVAPGHHEAIWDGRDDRGRALPAGMYFFELNASGQRMSRRVVWLK